MSRKLMFLLLLVTLGLTSVGVVAQPSGLPVDTPREDLFVADQIFRYSVIDNFNFWINGPHTPHRHALMMETLWYRDQESGARVNGAAVADPVYNDDFTQMNVELHDNIFWSDGVQFTADDLVYTVETLKATPDLNAGGWSSQLNQFMESVEKTDDFAVQFNLSESNPRFHTLFEARWNGIYMMPKHIFETVDDLPTFTFSEPVVLGSHVPVQTDPNGFWELLERREDWDRTAAGQLTGKGGPPFVLTIFYGDSTKKAIAMSRGELDVFFDVDIEAFESVLDTTPTARSWYTEFPWAYPNEVSSRMFTFNMETQPLFQNLDVRWALALSLDIVDMQTTYIGGIAKVTNMPVPSTPALMALYHDPMEEWFQNLQIDIGDGEMYSPYDATVPDQIAAWAEGQGFAVPGAPRDIFGSGWWKFDTETAARLLENNGFSRDNGGNWLTPDGEPFTIEIQAAPDENDAFRIANAAADMWSDFGIDVDLQGLERSVWEQNEWVGQVEVSVPWMSFVLPDGDAWPNLRGWHSEFFVPNGEDYRSSGGANRPRIEDASLDPMIDAMAVTNPDDPANVALVQDFLKHWTENMYFITAISFKKFVTWDERFWTGFPTSENPDYMPLYWFQGGRFAFHNLEPAS